MIKDLTGRMRLRQEWIVGDTVRERKTLVLQVEERTHKAGYATQGANDSEWRDATVEDISMLPNPFTCNFQEECK